MCIKCIEILSNLSTSNNWSECNKEWDLLEIIDIEDMSGKCICSHKIRYKYIIVNMNTNKEVGLGSKCINLLTFPDNSQLIEDLKDSFKTHCKYCNKSVTNFAQHELSVKHILAKDEYEIRKMFKKCIDCKEYRIKKPAPYKKCWTCHIKDYIQCRVCKKYNILKSATYKKCWDCYILKI